MVDVWLPYGQTEACLRVQARNLIGTIEPKQKLNIPNAESEIERALREPIDSKRLGEIAKSGDKVAIVIEDFNFWPFHIAVRAVLNELKSAGINDENMTIIFGYDAREPLSEQEVLKILGEDITGRIKIVFHDPKTPDLAYVGTTAHGTKVRISKLFADANVKVLVGRLGFHCYAGYRGGGKGVLPGVAGDETIKASHAMILSPNAKAGVLEGNPIHNEIMEAAKLVKVDFALNVSVDEKGNIVRAFAGSLKQSFLEGVKFVNEVYRVTIDRRADVVVVSPGGHPWDSNLFQACMAIENVIEAVKRGGVLILVAECIGGYGNKVFYDWMIKLKELKVVEREIKRNFALGGHMAYYLLSALQKVQIILVSAIPDYYAVNIFRLKTARTANEALKEALKITGENAKVWVIPYGEHTLPEVKTSE
ncbi:MAG: nickel-dependent lactate racemase [Candidatus Bathyarchaeia archaeon]